MTAIAVILNTSEFFSVSIKFAFFCHCCCIRMVEKSIPDAVGAVLRDTDG